MVRQPVIEYLHAVALDKGHVSSLPSIIVVYCNHDPAPRAAGVD